MKTGEKRNLWRWFEIGLLTLSLVAGLYVALLPADSLLNWYSSDDAFYYFKVAENLVSGRGLTFDGLNPTNGFHPLWMLICLPVFSLARFDLILPLRLLVVVASLLQAGTGILLARWLRRTLSEGTAGLAAVVWVFAPAIHGVVAQQGLESAVNALTLVWLLYLATAAQTEALTPRRLALIGLAGGLAVLARLDNIFLALILCAWAVLAPYGRFLRTVLIGDLGVVFLSGLLAYYVRLEAGAVYLQNSVSLPWLVGLGFLLYPLAFLALGLYRPAEADGRWKQIRCLAAASLAATLVLGGLLLGLQHLGVFESLPRSVIPIAGALVFAGSLLIRRLAAPSPHEAPAARFAWSFWKSAFQRAAACLAPLVVLLGGYLVWSQAAVGLWTPVSGQVKRWWGELPFTIYGSPHRDLATLLGFGARGAWSLALSPLEAIRSLASRFLPEQAAFLPGLLILAGLAAALLYPNRNWFLRTAGEMGLFAWGLGLFAHIFSYTATSYVHVRAWYWVGEMLFTLTLAALLFESLRLLLARGGAARSVVWQGLLALLGAAALLSFAAMTARRFPVRPADQHEYFTFVRYLEDHTEPGALIGLTGSGAMGYFIEDRVVVNLDGLINSPAYFESLRSGQADQFLDRLGLDYVFGHPVILTETDPYQQIFARRLEPLDDFGDYILYRYPHR
ncbi:MAG: hypothetical protein ABWK53_02330 [Anaerolineales bacterium]